MKFFNKLSHYLLFFLFYVTMFTCTAVAQKLELSANVNSGLFNYTGSGTTNNAYYYGPYNNNKFSISDPYSNKLTASYGLNVQGQMVYQAGFITGLQLGYDFLNIKQNLLAVLYTDYITAQPYIAASYTDYGSASVNTQFVNLSPYVGYRFGSKTITIDLTGGADFGFQTSNRQSVNINSNPGDFQNGHYKQSVDDKITDIRLKGGVAISCKKFSLNLSYAHGLTDYIKDDVYHTLPAYSVPKLHAYSQVIRFGLGYRFY